MFKMEKFIDSRCTQTELKKKIDKHGKINLASNELLSAKLALIQSKSAIYHKANTYPYYPRLRQKYADLLGLDSERTEFFAGSDSAIYFLLSALRTRLDSAIVQFPNYENYFAYASLNDIPVTKWPLDSTKMSFSTEELIHLIDDSASLNTAVILTNPNGFTGSIISEDKMLELAKILYMKGFLLVIDLAYLAFSSQTLAFYTNHVADKFDNVILINSLSKSHGLASERFGYVYAAPEFIQYLRQWNGINSIAGSTYDLVAAYIQEDLVLQEIRQTVIRHRDELIDGLERSLSYSVSHSEGNFVFIRHSSDREKHAMIEKFYSRGYVIRDLGNISCLSDCSRITIPADDIMRDITNIILED